MACPPTAGPAWQPGQGDIYQWDDLPHKPLPENQHDQPPPCQAPPMDDFHQHQGYEGCGSFGQFVPMSPPIPPPPPQPEQAPPMDFDNVASLSEDKCRGAMLDFVAEHCCYGKKPATQMDITKIEPTTALHYILETFCESRSTGYEYEPYRGGQLDGPENGPPPAPWNILCQPDRQFEDKCKKQEVPHTSVIQPCHHCHARGFLRCHCCHGLGWVRCRTCSGDGFMRRINSEGNHEHRTCNMCGGDGKRHCQTCGGDGRVVCVTCRGFRALRCFIVLTVKFINHSDDYIIEETDMPDELVRDVAGTLVFEQVLPQVWPIITYPIQEINTNSQKLVDKHYRSFNGERKIIQRQQLRAVPVTEVAYSWSGVDRRFWIYGRERAVHAPDYPQRCCWGCTIS